MTLHIDLKPEIEARIEAEARVRGVSVETFVASVIEDELGRCVEGEDPRLSLMRDAMNDQLFLADLAETMNDFKYVDGEHHY